MVTHPAAGSLRRDLVMHALEVRSLMVLSWHTCHKPERCLGKIVSAIRGDGMGEAVILLQEVGKWVGGVCSHGFVVHSRGAQNGICGSD